MLSMLGVAGFTAGSVILAAVTGLPEWAATGVSSAFMTGLWFQERRDRREAEAREREVLERALTTVGQLSRAAEVMEAFVRGKGSA